MNSGLQCLSNTNELTKYFLDKYYLKDINKSNPLGMQGKLAKAYGNLMKELHNDKQSNSSVQPFDFKKTLGTKISRFSGYNQQDSSELVNFL